MDDSIPFIDHHHRISPKGTQPLNNNLDITKLRPQLAAAAAATAATATLLKTYANMNCNMNTSPHCPQSTIGASFSDEALLRRLITLREPNQFDVNQLAWNELLRQRLFLAERSRSNLLPKIVPQSTSPFSKGSPQAIPITLSRNDPIQSVIPRYQSSTSQGPPNKKARRENTADVVWIESDLELNETFPLPSVEEKKVSRKKIGNLSSFRKTWKRLEHYSDQMDDTVTDQNAFVAEYFVRSLISRPTEHLRRKVRGPTDTTSVVTDNV